MQPGLQTLAHLPQAVHFLGSTLAREFSTVIAPNSQALTQRIQPMQPEEQTFIVWAPLSEFEQRTTACCLKGTNLIRFLGQALAQAPQPTHLL